MLLFGGRGLGAEKERWYGYSEKRKESIVVLCTVLWYSESPHQSSTPPHNHATSTIEEGKSNLVVWGAA